MSGQLDSYIQNNHTGLFSIPCTNISLKWIKDFNVKNPNYETSRRKHSALFDFGLSNIFFLVCILRQGGKKEKINKWNYIKLAQRRKLLTKREDHLLNGERDLQMVYLIRDAAAAAAKSLQSCIQIWQGIVIRDCVSKIHNGLIQLNIKNKNKTLTNFKKLAEDLNRHSSKKKADGKQAFENMLNIIREMQIKTTMKYHLALDRMASVKKKK